MKKRVKYFFIIQLILMLLFLTSCSSINERLAVGTQISTDGSDLKIEQNNPQNVDLVEEISETNELEVSISLTNEFIQTETANNLLETEEVGQTLEGTGTQIPLESGQITETAQTEVPEVQTQTPTPTVEFIFFETPPTVEGTVIEGTATATLEPTITPTPEGWLPSPTPAECLAARYVADVNYPDGSILLPGEVFYKTWRFQNVGSCIWRPEYAMIYVGGFKLNARTPVFFNVNVHPGQYVNLTMRLVAPEQNGTYRGDFKMMDLDGSVFGIGENAAYPYYVIINVVNGVVPSP